MGSVGIVSAPVEPGGNGWVPCHVVRRLAARGETVVSYDLMPPDDLLREFKLTRNHMAVVLDEYGGTHGLVVGHVPPASAVSPAEEALAEERDPDHAEPVPTPPWEQGPPTVLVLVRHGETADTHARVFSGSEGRDPELDELGRNHVAATASWVKRSARRASSAPAC